MLFLLLFFSSFPVSLDRQSVSATQREIKRLGSNKKDIRGREGESEPSKTTAKKQVRFFQFSPYGIIYAV